MKGKNKWRVQVADARTGATEEYDYVAGWSPQKVSLESVAQAAAAERTVATKQGYVPIQATFVGAVA